VQLLTVDEVRALEVEAIARGTPGRVLMERAGRGAARVAGQLLRGRRGPIVIVCGRGNNGGDGFVVARHLRARGRRVDVWLLGSGEAVTGDAAAMLQAWRRGGGRVRSVQVQGDVDGLAAAIRNAALVVDALLGTGLNTAVRGLAADVVRVINEADVPTLALDLPSGLSADTGQPWGIAVRAVATATFGAAKVGLYLAPGADYAGQVTLIDIGLGAGAAGRQRTQTELLEAGQVGALLPRRPRAAHKGTFGHVLMVAGSRGKLGAGLLAAEAAARSGAGLTTLAVPVSLQPAAEGRVPEIMTVGLPDDGDGRVVAPDEESLGAQLARHTVVVCGPGLGSGDGPIAFVATLARLARMPLVLDADGLNAVAGTAALRHRVGPTVLTPHPGEMARLVAGSIADVQADRLGVARRFAVEQGVVVVLKGAGTVIAAPDGQAAISPTGNPGLASGGSGDVLAGMVGALLAQGLTPFDAAVFAVFAHGWAADAVAARRGELGLLARDLLAELPATIAALQQEGRAPS
jgi:NAD(P)H-hydrate epimerase